MFRKAVTPSSAFVCHRLSQPSRVLLLESVPLPGLLPGLVRAKADDKHMTNTARYNDTLKLTIISLRLNLGWICLFQLLEAAGTAAAYVPALCWRALSSKYK